jgi:serine/threonine-protein kinase
LSKRPEHRYQSMDELIGDLDKLKAGNVPDAVPEMMSRSGGFNVPADYFNKAKMPEPVPAAPSERPQKSKWPLIAGLAGVAAAIAIVGAIFAKSSQSRAQIEPVATTAQVTPPAPPPAAPTAAPEALTLTKQVALAIVPAEAHVFQGDKDLGVSPVLVEVEEGKSVALSARMTGYKELDITVDGTKPRESFKLERAAAVATGRPAPVAHPVLAPRKGPDVKPEAKPKKKPGIGGGEIVNPWD